MSPSRAPSATSRVFLALLAVVLILSVAVSALLVWDSRRASYAEAERATYALAVVLAASPEVRQALADTAPDSAGEVQREMRRLRQEAKVSYITVMDAAGIRYTHPDPEQIGREYRGTIPSTPRTLTEEWTGTLGPSVRTIAPITGAAGELLGWVSVGITIDTIWQEIGADLPLVVAISLVFAAIGVSGAFIGRRITHRVTGDLSADAVRDAVVSYDSLRTLSESLSAQNHEHGNRLHTAIALLELGRVDAAIEMLAETSRRNQALVDLVTTRDWLDPAVSALILGKTAQAAERGVVLDTEVEPGVPSSGLGAMDLVSVIGNLLDNALDAAATGAQQPRSTRLRMNRSDDGGLRIEVSDSGDGFPPGARERIFDWGFSTKEQPTAAKATGRGVGLALVQRILQAHGGSLLTAEHPTTFTVILPPVPPGGKQKRSATA